MSMKGGGHWMPPFQYRKYICVHSSSVLYVHSVSFWGPTMDLWDSCYLLPPLDPQCYTIP